MSETPWTEAMLAAALFAVDPGTGGLTVRALPGPVRERYLSALRSYLPPGAPLRRVPLHIADDRLLGGLDLTATLQAGHPVAARGLLAEADGGVIFLAMAERVSLGVAARLAAAMDTGAVVAERDGMAMHSPSVFGVVALDEGLVDEHPPAALLDRLAFLVALDGIGLRDTSPPEYDRGHIKAARARLSTVVISDEVLAALCTTASLLGVALTRPLLLAVRAVRAAAALDGRENATEADARVAVRLVLAPRATTLPPVPERAEDSSSEDQSDDAPANEGRCETQPTRDEQPLSDILLEAAKAAMPAGLMARLLAGQVIKIRTSPAGGAGAMQRSRLRGRPVGVCRGEIKSGARLNLIETLRAAAPWQRLRRTAQGMTQRVIVMQDDFRITRFRQRTETTTIFLVDASGSAALNRLAEAKGAVELVLADCYVRRDRVALIAFRGAGAELLLPPTNSLVRAKRSLAGLPGGGATPLALGIDTAFNLADAIRRKGQSPVLILLSDGRANIARDGTSGRDRAETDALAAGRSLRGTGIACLVVDTSPRPATQAKRLAGEMGALYLPLPYADAAVLSRAVQATTRA